MKRTIMMALLASTAAVAAPATAQTEAPPAEQAAQEEQVPVGDIVVTARRVSESLQTTPVSVTAATGDALVARGVSDASAIQQIAPNVTFNPTASNSCRSHAAVVLFRGLGKSEFISQDDHSVGHLLY